MLNISCVVAVGSVAALVLTIVAMLVPRVRTIARRAAITSAMVFLASAAAFSHYADDEARARGLNTLSDMTLAPKTSAKLAHS